MSEQLDKIMERVAAVWQLKHRPVMAGVYAMWRGEKLHSFATLGTRSIDGVSVPMVHWSEMKTMGEMANVPTVVFFLDDKGSVYYANWPPISGMMYPTLPDDDVGGVVAVTTSEFSLVETKK